MKNKKIYGFVLLALIIMLLPIGMVSAKYKQTEEVGTVTLDIAPPILSPNWYIKKSSEVTISELIVDSFKPEANSDIYSKLGLNWEDGIPVGYDSSNPDNFKNNVRLFEKDNHDGTYNVYILAIGKNPVIFPENSNSLFAGWKGTDVTEKITFNNIDTSTVNDMQWMFYYCRSLTSLDISSFKTDKVTHMNNMFAGCSNMTSLTLGVNFNTSNVINMADMFNGCSSLTNLDVKQFDTSQVTNMTQMFNSCKHLTSLDLSNFNTSQVTDMKYMFNTCERLTSLNINSFDTSNVTNMENMFDSCKALTSLDLSNFSISNETNMHNFFTFCSQLKQVTLGRNFKFNNISDTTTLLPDQKGNIQNADGYWYTTSVKKFNSTEAAKYHNEHKATTTYYAVQSEAPSSINTFSLLTENGTINGAIQGN
ncbi:MAG: BspA family leucine-rich repeat surface protein [Clostridia bacterium]|nr:BspA family leucine-rich repeat surface protein [Clostridia bacterium]